MTVNEQVLMKDALSKAEEALSEICPRRLAGQITVLVSDCAYCTRMREIMETLEKDLRDARARQEVKRDA